MMIPALHLEKKKKKKYEHLAMLLLVGEKGYKLLKKKLLCQEFTPKMER